MADFWSSPLAAATDQVRILSRETLLPSSPTSRHAFFLPCLDILWQDIHYNRRVLFYERPASSPADNATHRLTLQLQQLKHSLAQCLVHYFPWCGRVTKGVDPPHRLFIDCNDAGVDFVEASIHFPLSLLAQDGFQMKPLFEQLCQRLDLTGDCLFSNALLAVQATFFSDGGLALGITQSHIVADGQSLWNFMISWAECSRGVSLSLPPLHDRQRLALPDPSPEKGSQWSFALPMREEDKEDEEVDVSAVRQVEGKDSAGGTTPSTNGRTESTITAEPAADPLVQCALELSFTAVKKLKSEVGEGFSSYEVICAHFWQRSNAARQAPKHSLTYFTVLADCRSRMTPPLPPSYFGNVISFHMASSTAGKIAGNETLRTTAGRIHELVVRGQEDVVSFMHYLETHDNRFLHNVRSLRVRGKGHNVASSPRFPVYQVDFGWGKPVAVRPGKVGGEGEIVFFGGRPGSGEGDVEICTALPASVLKRLLADPLFLPKLISSGSGPKGIPQRFLYNNS